MPIRHLEARVSIGRIELFKRPTTLMNSEEEIDVNDHVYTYASKTAVLEGSESVRIRMREFGSVENDPNLSLRTEFTLTGDEIKTYPKLRDKVRWTPS